MESRSNSWQKHKHWNKEPLLKWYGDDVIFSPHTSVANSKQVIKWVSNEIKTRYADYCTQYYDLQADDIEFEFESSSKINVYTKNIDFQAKYVVNWAGQQSLNIANRLGIANQYSILPVKGNYLISDRPMNEVKTLVYPVPMKGTYFLGVHSTITPDGYVKIGPSATPAFALENYNKLDKVTLQSLRKIVSDYCQIAFSDQVGLLFALAYQELPKLSKRRMMNSLKIHDLDPAAFKNWYHPGIRAQLIHKSTNKFVEDFLLVNDEKMMHVLNVISPGWTWASPFADHIVDEISSKFTLD